MPTIHEAKSPPSSRTHPLIQYWPVIAGVAAAVFSFGGGWASHVSLEAKLGDLKRELDEHQDRRLHPDNTTRVDLLTQRMVTQESASAEARSERRQLMESYNMIIIKLDRVCIATGAQCGTYDELRKRP